MIAAFSVLSFALLIKWLPFGKKKSIIDCGPESKSKTLTFLAQDGKLVEVDASHITQIQQKISNTQLQNWIKRS